MKAFQKRTIGLTSVILLALIIVFLLFYRPLPEGAVSGSEIVSFCVGDATNNDTPELLVLAGEGKIESGERHGQYLLVCDASAQADVDDLGYIPPEKIWQSIDLTDLKPLKVQLGDVNGDGVNEVTLCVYKTAKFHPVLAKRPFFFNLVEGNLIPVWLGSRLSRPFDDYILYDIDADEIHEIVSVEALEDGSRVLAVYNWRGFGFEMLTQSKEFDGTLCFDLDSCGQSAESGIIRAILSDGSNQTRLQFHLTDDLLVCAEIN